MFHFEGGTNTHLPIRTARELMFTAANGDREDIPNLCIVLTDGESYEPELTAAEALRVDYNVSSVYTLHYYSLRGVRGSLFGWSTRTNYGRMPFPPPSFRIFGTQIHDTQCTNWVLILANKPSTLLL